MLFLVINDVNTKENDPKLSQDQKVNKTNRNLMEKLRVMLDSRCSYAFSWKDYLYSYASCWIRGIRCIWWITKLPKSSKSLSFRNLLFKYGLNRFKKETDIIEIIKSVRMLKILAKIFLSNNQIKLLTLENSNLLSKDLRLGSNNEHEIVQNQNGIKMRSNSEHEIVQNQNRIKMRSNN